MKDGGGTGCKYISSGAQLVDKRCNNWITSVFSSEPSVYRKFGAVVSLLDFQKTHFVQFGSESMFACQGFNYTTHPCRLHQELIMTEVFQMIIGGGGGWRCDNEKFIDWQKSNESLHYTIFNETVQLDSMLASLNLLSFNFNRRENRPANTKLTNCRKRPCERHHVS